MTARRASREPAGCAGYAAFAQDQSSLTILGIVIGVTSVISVASIIDGLNRYIQEGGIVRRANVFRVAYPAGPRFGRLPEKIRLRKYFQDTDAEFVRAVCPSVDFVTTFGTRAFFFGDSNDIRYAGTWSNGLFSRGGTGVRRRYTPFLGCAREIHLQDLTKTIHGMSSFWAQPWPTPCSTR